MPKYRVTSPDGQTYEITAPDGASEADVMAYAQQQFAQPQQPPAIVPKSQRGPAPEQEVYDPTEGQSFLENAAAGVGKSFVDTWRGVKQLTGNMTAEEVDEARRLDAPLMNTGGGFTGNIVGTAGQVLAPGGVAAMALRTPRIAAILPQSTRLLTAVKSASLPTTIRGAAAQGAALGGLQATGEEDSRLLNAGVGGLLGTAGAAAPRVIAGAYRGSSNYLDKLTNTGSARRAARVLLEEAENPAALRVSDPSRVPGVVRSLAEETKDAGIARLERNARSTGRGWDTQDRANNAARVTAIEKFAGDDAAIDAAKRARDVAANPLRREAMKIEGVDTSRLLSQIKRLESMQSGRPAIQSGLRQVRDLLTREIPDAERIKAARAPLEQYVLRGRKSKADFEAAKEALKAIKNGEAPSVSFTSETGKQALAAAKKALGRTAMGQDRVVVLDNVRKTIGDMLSGKFGGESAQAMAGARELMAVKAQLDRVLAKQAPEYGQYLSAFRNGSKPINRMEVGQTLLDRSGKATLDAVTGKQVLTPAAFSSSARNLDRVARDATGFNKAKAADILNPDDMAVIRSVQDDLERREFAATAGSGGGSPTFERFKLDQKEIDGLASRIPIIGKLASYFDEIGEARMKAQMDIILRDPAKARAVLSSLPPNDRRMVENALSRIGGTTGSLLLPIEK